VERLARDLEDVDGRRDRAAYVVHAAVVGDAVEPSAQVDVAVVGAQCPVGADEDVLQHVLRIVTRTGAQHLAHVGEQPLAVAVVDGAERLVVTGPEERDQLLVRAEPQQRRAERPPSQAHRCVQC
jgi:hypothetical protein